MFWFKSQKATVIELRVLATNIRETQFVSCPLIYRHWFNANGQNQGRSSDGVKWVYPAPACTREHTVRTPHFLEASCRDRWERGIHSAAESDVNDLAE